MSSRGYSRHSRSPGRRFSGGDRVSPSGNDHFLRRDSPERSKRGRWESPSRSRLDFARGRDNGSPMRSRRTGLESPPRSWRPSFDSSPKYRRPEFNSPPRLWRPGFDDGMLLQRPGIDDVILRGDPHLRVEDYRPLHGHPGLVFLCSSATQRECFVFGVFGLPLAQREIVERIVPGTRLFLYNLDTEELFGVFEAVSPGGINLVPEAFKDFKAAYAAQVRFRILRECFPLGKDACKDVLQDNLSQQGKFDCELNVDQVSRLMDLFSRTEVRPEPRLAMAFQDSALGLGPIPPLPEEPLLLQALHQRERNDLNLHSGRELIPEARLLLNKGDPLLIDGSNPLVANGPVDALAILGKLEEVDLLALKYLQNDPNFTGVRLEPIDLNLLSHSFGDRQQPGIVNPLLDNPPVGPMDTSLGANSVTVPPSMQQPLAFSATPGMRAPVLAGVPGTIAPFTSNPTALGMDPTSNGKGLLPIPGSFQHVPPHPLPGGNPIFVAGMGMGPSGMPLRPPQAGAHMGNFPRVSPNKLSKKKSKKNKKKKPQSQAAGSQRDVTSEHAVKKEGEAGADHESDKDSQLAAEASA